MRNKKYHFIALGGSVMSELAIALQAMGSTVTGSDDEIYDPAYSRLKHHDLLPPAGWDPERITADLDGVILGMHALEDNPELKRARKLEIPIYSFPEFVYKASINKQRIVIGGSHGKTTTVAMIIHVLRVLEREFDYLCGSQVDGFDQMVRLSDAPVIIIEGDEYPSSKLDPTPKFLKYQHHIGVINGIAWDHVNAFPTFEKYVSAFEKFADQTPKAGALVFNNEDDLVSVIGKKDRADVVKLEYGTHPFTLDGDAYQLVSASGKTPVQLLGKHNMLNLNAAKTVCNRLGVQDEQFYEAISSFAGTSNRLELIGSGPGVKIFKDYAHSPSKLRATVDAIRQAYPQKVVKAIYELHTFSSFRSEFLPEYRGTLAEADKAAIFISPEKMKARASSQAIHDDIGKSFDFPELKLFDQKEQLWDWAVKENRADSVYLFMSSGNFDHLDLEALAQELTQ